jgi:hypothetical protein
MNFSRLFLLLTLLPLPFASADERRLPKSFTDLNAYVVTAPNQGDVVTCLFMASTGAMEILLSKQLRIKHPKQLGITDISERYLISMRNSSPVPYRTWFEDAFMIFNTGEAILAKDMPFEAYDEYGDENLNIWNTPDNFETAPRIKLPKVDTVFLFSVGDKYSKNVLDESHVLKVKQALVEHKSPIITIGNDEAYWHATVITGYDDTIEGDCYELDSKVCRGKKGAFYVRDSFGNGLETRSYEWFIRRQNSAAVAKLAEN